MKGKKELGEGTIKPETTMNSVEARRTNGTGGDASITTTNGCARDDIEVTRQRISEN
jgi:hypothetical protein